MTKEDSARTFYESAREELIQRIRLRDNVLLFYLGAVGTISGVALGGGGVTKEILFILPFLTLGVAILVSQHNALIGSLGHFCACEIEPFFEDSSNSEYAPQWDSSDALEGYKQQAIKLRSWGHTLMILVPAIASLSINYSYIIAPVAFGILWWSAFISLVLSSLVIYQAHLWRKSLYRDIFDT